MEVNELLSHMNDISEKEINYRDHRSLFLSPFYQYLEQINQKDENGIYTMTHDLLNSSNTRKATSITRPYFWDNLSDDTPGFIIKKASRFYREPYSRAEFIALRYVYSGNCQIFTPHKNIVLSKGDLIMLSPGFVFSQQLEEDDHVFTMMFDKTYIRETILKGILSSNDISELLVNYVSDREISQNYIIFHTKDNLRVKQTIEEILCEKIDPGTYTQEMMSSLLKILLIQMLYCPYEFANNNTRNLQKIAGMMNYVDLHYKDVTLSDLAEEFGYSEKYVSRLFQKATGVSFKDYIFNLKYENICFKLVNPDLPVDEIIHAEGISNETYFFHRFREIYGVTPSEYRHNNRR